MATVTEIWKCPGCGAHVDIASLGLYAEVRCPRCFLTARVHSQLGNFRLDSVLGIGGMSVVYRAFDVVLHRPLALKVLNDNFRDQPERIERFENESAMMARVRHENVTAVYSAGRAYGQFYIAMELVEGVNLEYMVTEKKPMEPRAALEVIQQVALGLDAAHNAGLLHRDMKPGNVLITAEGNAKVIDFGLAIDSKEGDTEEIIWATPFYVPPETLQRKPEDVRTDIYALGMTLRYLLTGIEKFDTEATSLNALVQIKRKLQPLSQLRPDLLPALYDLVDHMTEFQPAERPENYHELLEEIRDVIRRLDAEAAQPDSGKPMLKALPAGIAMLVCAGLGAFIAYESMPPLKEAKQKFIPVASANRRASNTRAMNETLSLLQQGDYRQAVRALLGAAAGAEEPTMGAWCAQLAKILLASQVNDPSSEQVAQEQLERHLSNTSNVSDAGKSIFRMLSEMDHTDYPGTQNWQCGICDWEMTPKSELRKNIRSVAVNDNWHPVVKLMELFILAEKAVWFGYEDLNRECREAIAKLQGLEEYAVLLRALNDPKGSIHRVNGNTRAERMNVEAMLRRRDFTGALPYFNHLANDTNFSPEVREEGKIFSEACTMARIMLSTLKRKRGSAFNDQMNNDELVALARGLSPTSRPAAWADSSLNSDSSAEAAIDGKTDTLWRPNDNHIGHSFVLDLDHMDDIEAIRVDWNRSTPMSFIANIYSDGKSYSTPVSRRSSVSIFNVQNRPIDRFELVFEDTAAVDADGIGITNIYLIKKDGSTVNPPQSVGQNDFADELRAVLLFLTSKRSEAYDQIRYVISREGAASPFSTIALDWMKRLQRDLKRIPVTGHRKIQTPADMIRSCRSSVPVRVLPGKTIKFTNAPPLPAAQIMSCDLEVAELLRDRGVVEIMPGNTVAVLGVKDVKYKDFTPQVGKIQPCPAEYAQDMQKSGIVKVISSSAEWTQVSGNVDRQSPFSALMQRIIDLDATVK